MRVLFFTFILCLGSHAIVAQSFQKKFEDSLSFKPSFKWYSNVDRQGLLSLNNPLNNLEFTNLPRSISESDSHPSMPIYKPLAIDSHMKVYIPDSIPKQYIRNFGRKE